MNELTTSVVSRSHSARPPSIPFARTEICAEAQNAVREVLESGWVTTGEQVFQFERELADYVGAKHGVAVSSCTAAIELALRALHLPRGSKVVMSTTTFCGAASAIVHAGLVPVLADVEPTTGMPSEATIAEAVAEVGGVSAMVVVHLGGYPANVSELAAAAGLSLDMVIEDAAHALGASVGDQPVGTVSRATCFSFYATKNLSIGEGGMVTTDDDELAATIVRTRLHGLSADAWQRYRPGASWRYDVADDGLKANMTDVQAAVGRAQLRHFERAQARRARAADRYDAQVVNIPGLSLPPRPTRGRHAWHLYAVRVRPEFGVSRDAVITALSSRGIGSSVHFIPVHLLSWHGGVCLGPRAGYPGAESVFQQTLSLPLDHVLSDEDIDTVCTALAEIGGSR